jgi:hypothetical protein
MFNLDYFFFSFYFTMFSFIILCHSAFLLICQSTFLFVCLFIDSVNICPLCILFASNVSFCLLLFAAFAVCFILFLLRCEQHSCCPLTFFLSFTNVSFLFCQEKVSISSLIFRLHIKRQHQFIISTLILR